jgi:hypothetical protein
VKVRLSGADDQEMWRRLVVLGVVAVALTMSVLAVRPVLFAAPAPAAPAPTAPVRGSGSR